MLPSSAVSRRHSGMRPQDVVVLLKLVSAGGKTLPLAELASSLGISAAEIFHSLNRSHYAGLLLSTTPRSVARQGLLDFLFFGLKYVFPTHPGPVMRGMPTAHSAAPLNATIRTSDHDHYVWPDADGKMRGQSIEPLFRTVPDAARRDPALHELLALADALRVGRAREVNLARKELEQRILLAS